MKQLILTAHPSAHGFTHKIANAIAEKNPEAEIVNLYDEQWTMNFLKFETPKEMSDPPVKKELQKKVAVANELISPIWNGTEPAILKNFYDVVFTARFAFQHTKKGPQGLLKRKTARFFCTYDDPGWSYRYTFCPLHATWRFLQMGFCGIKTKSFVVWQKMQLRDENNHAILLQKAQKRASR